MRLIGSFQTMVIHGRSGSTYSLTSLCCSACRSGATVPAMDSMVARAARAPVAVPERRLCDDRAVTTALFTDRYELTMLGSALRDGSAERQCVFEVFARRLPDGRRYGVVAGTARLLDAIEAFRFEEPELDFLTRTGVIDVDTRDWLADFRFGGDVDGYPEGELY